MSKKKFSLSSDFVKVAPEALSVPTSVEHTNVQNKQSKASYTGPNTNRVKFGTSIDAELKSKFKIWVANQGTDMSTELENAIKLIMK